MPIGELAILPTATPAVTVVAGSPAGVICVIVLKNFVPVLVELFPPVIASVCAVPSASVPVTVKAKLVSFPADVIVTSLGTVRVTEPPEAKAPAKTKFV